MLNGNFTKYNIQNLRYNLDTNYCKRLRMPAIISHKLLFVKNLIAI